MQFNFCTKLKNMQIENIKKALIKSCIKGKPYLFIPFLISRKVKTGFPNKWRFYSFFRHMLCCAKEKTSSDLKLKINTTNIYGNNQLEYSFYDDIHLHSRFSIIIEEKEDSILIDILPF
jgi:hypothetical protein